MGETDNHKPDLDIDVLETQLKPSVDDDSAFQLSINEGDDHYKYEGPRHAKEDQYVLIFDPEKRHFVLHQVDSSFDMNLIETPEENNAAILASEYEQIGGGSGPKPRRKSAMQNKIAEKTTEKRRKVEKPKKTAAKRDPTPDAEDEDSDDGLTIEYPDGPPPPRFQHSTPLYRAREPSTDSDADADADFEEDEPEEHDRDVEELNLHSPAKNGEPAEVDDDAEEELDLEAELELALEKEMGAESSESEEE